MVNRLPKSYLPEKGQEFPTKTMGTPPLHIEVGTLLKTDLDRAHSPIRMEVLELMRK